MKKQIRLLPLLPLLAILWAASTAHAQVVVQYAADDGEPDSAIWTPFNHGVNPPTLETYQNEAVFVIADDLTDNSAARYTRTFTTNEVNTLNARGSRIHARVALLVENLTHPAPHTRGGFLYPLSLQKGLNRCDGSFIFGH